MGECCTRTRALAEVKVEWKRSKKKMVVRTTLEIPPWSPSRVLVQPSAV